MADTSRRGTPRKAGGAHKKERAAATAARAVTAPKATKAARATRAASASSGQTGSQGPSLGAASRAGLRLPRPSRRVRPTPGPASGRERRERYQREKSLRVVRTVLLSVAGVAAAALLAFLILRNTGAFAITGIEVEPTEHVSEEDVRALVQVPEGATLLNVDTSAIEEMLRADSWVASASFERVFPHTLRVVIHEQTPDRLVVMASGSIAWYLGDEGSWIEPVKIEASEDQSVEDAALEVASSQGLLLITDVPSTVSPVSGSEATDETIAAVESFREGFSEDFSSRVVSYSAADASAIACTLENGVEVLLGSATNISYKEQVVTSLLEEYEGQITYINVRVPSDPAVRRVDSENVQAGTGALAQGE